ncbi:polysaccharide lyase family 1 protein [Lentzea sp. HUAS12]|uniref:pectate lyase family protein n=1 Tax=Lentzea sp. HUAS12 TaxID=2951806 RepID=UPI0020A02EB5|nr:pectate lyase [Lentzea sp. HUAS12]USX53198.1 pectate lyase [Lentzea sp. HUAS12]
MRLFVSALVLACAGTGVVPAHAHDPARQVLAAGDGWASAGPGTTGGAKARNVRVVRTRAELVEALAVPGPRIIAVKGVIDANTADDGTPLRCADYETDGYTRAAYLAAYDPAVWGWEREPEGPLEEARARSAEKQEATIVLDVPADTTIIGASRGAGITGGSLRIHNVRNVIVRDLTFRDTHDCFPQWDPTDTSPGASPGNWNSLYDSVSVQKSENVWVHRNTFTDAPNQDAKQPLHFGRPYQVHDGQLDITNGADLVTVSRNLFAEHGKTMLIGSSNSSTTDPGKLRVSVHHNVFRDVLERAPRVRFGQVHVYNNLYEGAQTYSWGVGVQSQIYAQNNYVKGIAAEEVVYNWGGTGITDVGNLLDGEAKSFVEAYNTAFPGKALGRDAGWTPTLDRGLEPAQGIRHLKAGARR